MKILNIEVKYNNGDTVYSIEKNRVLDSCHICEGEGLIDYKNKKMTCPECIGVGYFRSNKFKHVVIESPLKVTQVKITINSNGDVITKYKVSDGLRHLNRDEDRLFDSLEEAQNKCDELNTDFKLINTEDIIIQDAFKDHTPSPEKVMKKMEFYNENNSFKKPIRVNKDNVLQDGYIDYLLCKMFDIKTVKALIV